MLSIQRYVQSINYSLIISRLKDRYFCPTGTSLQGPEKPTCAPCILEELPLLVSCCQFGGIFFFLSWLFGWTLLHVSSHFFLLPGSVRRCQQCLLVVSYSPKAVEVKSKTRFWLPKSLAHECEMPKG